MSADSWLEYRVRARNTAVSSENAIHDDSIARQYGFRGALVPGVTIYAYLTRAIVLALGHAWLARGTVTVKFVKPVLDGEEVVVAGSVTAHDQTGVSATVTASTAASGECAVATVTLPAAVPTPVNLTLYPAAPLPTERPPVSRAYLESLTTLGSPQTLYDDARAQSYVETVSDDLPLYRDAHAWTHPAFFLDQANRAVDRNVRLGPWIHVGSTVRHLGGARIGEPLVTRGRVRSLFEKKGREFVELDLVVVAGASARPVAHVLHTAIYKLSTGRS